MAGGMNSPGVQRRALARWQTGDESDEQVGRNSSDQPEARPPTPLGRHCWAVGVPGRPGRWLALLVDWRRRDDGWSGRVLLAYQDAEDGCTTVVDTWLSASYLRPIGIPQN
jgi:hypothetical protein